jgi:hypothetical protein
MVGISDRAAEVAALISEAMVEEGLHRPAFGPTISAASIVLVRLERADRALTAEEDLHEAGDSDADPDRLDKLRRDASRWATNARGYLSDLGLSPASLARIGKDMGVGKAARASAALRELDGHLASRYGDADSTGDSEP